MKGGLLMPSSISKFFSSSEQSAIVFVTKDVKATYLRIPEVKTVANYEIAMVEAVCNWLENDDLFILELLKDAIENNKKPSKNRMYEAGKVNIEGLDIKKSKLTYLKNRKEFAVVLSLKYASIEITPMEILMRGYIKVLSTKAWNKLVEIQQVLQKIQRLMDL